jgi:Fur family peroxide stress response transcriptional regulator
MLMRTPEELCAYVRAIGGKVTASRVLIYRALQHDTSHPTAEELHARLLPQLPSLSLTTVYKTLNELVAWGDVRRFDTGDGTIHFDPDTSDHTEIICVRCHRVTDLPKGIDDPAHAPLPDSMNGYRIIYRAQTLYGYCPACQIALQQEAQSVEAGIRSAG